MNNNMQGGDIRVNRKYFKTVMKYIPLLTEKCLDLGSGTTFVFDKMLYKGRKVSITCLDRLNADHVKVPNFLNYIQGSVEEKIVLKEIYDCIFCFEVIEHIDNTDMLIKNCYAHLSDEGRLFIACPNLASLYCRIELMLGYQPHLLEISNVKANYGTGIFGRFNNPSDSVLHHIRGITYRAMRELLLDNGFKIIKVIGEDASGILRLFPRIASSVVFICEKNKF